ncbi:MAG TPA: hypothetical protein PLE54_12475 [Burkholderiaceae bacterium]|nr:hypothetical protein [Burkholderiaceae bacterium]
MTNSILKHAVALGAAITTTLVLFSSVAALADNDKAALVAAKSVRGTQVVQSTSAIRR